MENHVQTLVRESEHVRTTFFLYKVMPELAESDGSTRLRHRDAAPEGFIDGASPTATIFGRR